MAVAPQLLHFIQDLLRPAPLYLLLPFSCLFICFMHACKIFNDMHTLLIVSISCSKPATGSLLPEQRDF